MIGRSWFVRWGRGMVSRCFMNWFVGVITWGSFIGYFNNVTRVAISSVVLYNLGTAIGKGYTVFAISRVAVASFICPKVDSRIIISNSIFVLIFSWYISVSWFFVGWGVVSWSRFVNWGWLVNWSWLVDRGGLVNWSRLINWGWFVDRCWFVSWSSTVDWSMSNGMAVSWGMSVLHSSMA